MSNSIIKFNGLNGTVATREELQEIVTIAQQEEQNHIATKLQTVLNENEDAKFDISLVGNALEIAPKSMLNGLHFEEFSEEENTGLNKAVTSSDIYQMITDKMLEMIKEASGKGYVKKWKGNVYGTGYTIPFNFDSKKRYRGVNVFLLTGFEPLENPFFMTFKQIEANKGKLKKGSKGSPVIYFTNLYKITDKKRDIDFGTYDFNKAKEYAAKNGFKESDIYTLPILKYYNVFNGKDIENIDFDLENFKIGYIEKELPTTERLPIADAIVENYPAPAPPIKHGGNEAFYAIGGKGYIQIPHIADFETAQDYYRTLLHELSHSTGDFSRLNRKIANKFGTKDYAFEELVAEWGATFLSAEAGIIFHTNKNHAEYIKNWNNSLVHLKDDNKFIMKACTLAQKLTDYILQFDESGTPLYLKNLKVDDAKIEVKKKEKKPVEETEIKALFSKINNLCKEDLKEYDFEPTKHKFKAGDLYRSDFDYKGMLQAGAKINKKISTVELEKIYNSFVDVNYHETSKVLWEALQLLKEKQPKKEVSKPTTKSVGVATTKKKRGVKVVGNAIKKEVIASKYKVGDLVTWENKKVVISRIANFGKVQKFQLILNPEKGEKHAIWTDENTLNSEAKKPLKKEVATKTEKPVKVDKNGQTALFGVKEKPVATEPKKHSKIQKIALAGNENESEFFDVAGEVGKFLQQVEKKPVESVVITLDGQQGAGKTTTLYKFMDSFASTGNDCLFLSLEEHPSSSLAKEKVVKYLSKAAQDKTDSVGEVESVEELYEMIAPYDIIFIDSWQKLQRMVGAIRLDEDLRKKFNGKVFVVIFQQTTTGRTKGGAEVVFDGDIIIKMVKENSFADNYAYFDKNRYTKIAIEDIRYNIANGTVYNPNATEEPATELQPVQEVEFSFIVE